MSLSGKVFKLNNGVSMPAIAYGTGTRWFKLGRDEIDENLVSSLKTALNAGFVHIDGAEVYNTDAEIGKAIEGVDRSSLFLTNKYLTGDSTRKMKSPHGTPYESLKARLESKLKTDYVDLFLLHTPFIFEDFYGFSLEDAWKLMEKLHEEGLAKSIGVSNFLVEDLERIAKVAKIKPAVNQIEFNAYLQNQTPGIFDYCQKNDILVTAYSPLGPIVKGEPGPFTEYLEEVGSAHGKTPTQVLLRWVLQKNVMPITTSLKEERIKAYLGVFDFELSTQEVANITKKGAEHPTLRQYFTGDYEKFN